MSAHYPTVAIQCGHCYETDSVARIRINRSRCTSCGIPINGIDTVSENYKLAYKDEPHAGDLAEKLRLIGELAAQQPSNVRKVRGPGYHRFVNTVKALAHQK